MPIVVPQKMNQRWSLDFVSDATQGQTHTKPEKSRRTSVGNLAHAQNRKRADHQVHTEASAPLPCRKATDRRACRSRQLRAKPVSNKPI
jgi:hypothetical protein